MDYNIQQKEKTGHKKLLVLFYALMNAFGKFSNLLLKYYQNMEKKDEEHEEQGMNEALTEARPSESAELKNRVHG